MVHPTLSHCLVAQNTNYNDNREKHWAESVLVRKQISGSAKFCSYHFLFSLNVVICTYHWEIFAHFKLYFVSSDEEVYGCSLKQNARIHYLIYLVNQTLLYLSIARWNKMRGYTIWYTWWTKPFYIFPQYLFITDDNDTMLYRILSVKKCIGDVAN